MLNDIARTIANDAVNFARTPSVESPERREALASYVHDIADRIDAVIAAERRDVLELCFKVLRDRIGFRVRRVMIAAFDAEYDE